MNIFVRVSPVFKTSKEFVVARQRAKTEHIQNNDALAKNRELSKGVNIKCERQQLYSPCIFGAYSSNRE